MTGQKVLDLIGAPGRLAEVERFCPESCEAPASADFNRLDLIVEELFLNIAMHACPGEPVRLACSMPAPLLVELEFSYRGPKFNPSTDAREPDLNASLAERPIG